MVCTNIRPCCVQLHVLLVFIRLLAWCHARHVLLAITRTCRVRQRVFNVSWAVQRVLWVLLTAPRVSQQVSLLSWWLWIMYKCPVCQNIRYYKRVFLPGCSSNPCQNGGTCNINAGSSSLTCSCPACECNKNKIKNFWDWIMFEDYWRYMYVVCRVHWYLLSNVHWSMCLATLLPQWYLCF